MVAKYSPAFWECPLRYGLCPLYIVQDDPCHEPYLAKIERPKSGRDSYAYS
jgi:hypothetical protein